jgi:hypothetical protein
MKTYTMVIDGEPVTAFRARDDAEAASFPERLWGPDSFIGTGQKVRSPCDRPRYRSGRSRHVRVSAPRRNALHEADDEMRKRHAAANPDGLLVPLDETEEEDEAP